MKNLFYKIKVKTMAIGFLTCLGIYYGGKKVVEYMNDFGEIEPLTDEEIKDTLGIGAGDEYTIK